MGRFNGQADTFYLLLFLGLNDFLYSIEINNLVHRVVNNYPLFDTFRKHVLYVLPLKEAIALDHGQFSQRNLLTVYFILQ